MMRWLNMITATAMLLPTIAVGDDWKDESGKGRFGYRDGQYQVAVGYWDDDWEWDWDDDDWYDGDFENWNDGFYRPWRMGVPTGVPGFVQTPLPAPRGMELAELDYGTLRRVTHASIIRFDQWLMSIPGGGAWQRHFQTRPILQFLTPHANTPPTAADRQEFVRILAIFDEAAADAELSTLTQQEPFRSSHAALRELATRPDQRLMRQTSIAARHLQRSLTVFATSASWQRYLALPDEIMAAADRPPGNAELQHSRVDRRTLASIRDRFDSVSRNPEYHQIAALPAFQMTHERLVELERLGADAKEAPRPAPDLSQKVDY